MKKHANSKEETFNPQSHKTFEGALCAFFSQECPQIGGVRTRQVLVQTVSKMIDHFFPETSHMRPGQILWTTVHKDEKNAYGKSIGETELITVRLDVTTKHDATDRASGRSLRNMRREAVARLFQQAFEQGGCLTSAEVSIILKISVSIIVEYIKEWEKENGKRLPRRGSIHDIGRTLTHKREIIEKLFLERKSVQQVSRETNHSFNAIERYISAFKQVLLCKQKNLNTEETAFAIGRTKGLVREYETLIDEFREKNYAVEAMLNIDINCEPLN